MAKPFPICPANPERSCWGCDLYCAADDMASGNGSDRTQHPEELFGQDWHLRGHDFALTQLIGHTSAVMYDAQGAPPKAPGIPPHEKEQT
jgi:Protein of unknown function (DUF3079)